jgi:hypothetical protein
MGDELIHLQKQRDAAKTVAQKEIAQRAMDDYWFPKTQKAQRKKPKEKLYDEFESEDEWT